MGSQARPEEARRHNRIAVLRRLHLGGERTVSELTQEFGLNRSTVGAIVADLKAGQFVERLVRLPTGRSDRKKGRPSPLVSLNPHSVAVLALDVTRSSVEARWVGLGGTVLDRRSRPVHGGGTDAEAVLATIVDLVRGVSSRYAVRGVGVSLPGVVRRSDGFVVISSELSWRDEPFGAKLSEELQLPVRVAKRAEASAFGEFIRGVGSQYDDLVFVTVAGELTAGVVVDGSLLSGATGFLGEVGHLPVSVGSAQPCAWCGIKGCWVDQAGRAALGSAAGLSGLATEEDIRKRLAAAPEVMSDVLSGYGDRLGAGLAILARVFAPQIIVLGGVLAALPDSIVLQVEQAVRGSGGRAEHRPAGGATRVIRSSQNEDIHLVHLLGAAELAFDMVLETI